MKMTRFTLALAGVLMVAPACVGAQQMDPGMSGMTGMQHGATAAEVQGTGVVKAIDMAKGTIALQHEAIAPIGWPAMTMAFRVASSELLKTTKVGDTVQFGLRPAGMGGTVTSITQVKP